jgi:hypothetical protein
MSSRKLLGLTLLLSWLGASGSWPAVWPLSPQNQVHPLGNGWGEYQNYSSPPAPYFHPGIDVMALAVGVPCYAVAHGWVKAWLTTDAQWHWRLAIADSSLAFTDSCNGYLYAHIDSTRPHASVGDEVNPGDQIGYLVPWPVTGFDHTHHARIRDAGSTWGQGGQADWTFVENPLNFISPNTDTAKPVIETAVSGSKFAYFLNNSSTTLQYNNLSGDVDIVARIYDRFGVAIPGHSTWEKINPYKIEYAIHPPGGSSPRTLSFLFGHYLPWNDVNIVNTVFKNNSPCTTRGDYSNRVYYYIVTNTDGDSTLEVQDTSGAWHTKTVANGPYWVVVYASDQNGNTTPDSQLVTVNNPVGVEELGGRDGKEVALSARPNPFRGDLEVSYFLPGEEEVALRVYNAAGQLVRILAAGKEPGGVHHARWDGKEAGAGIYFLRFKAGSTIATRRVMLLK